MKWGKGEILQDHFLLLLLPLRDNNLKEAKTLTDLFYHPNKELQEAVVKEIRSRAGSNGTAGTAMAVPVLEGGKMASLGF